MAERAAAAALLLRGAGIDARVEHRSSVEDFAIQES